MPFTAVITIIMNNCATLYNYCVKDVVCEGIFLFLGAYKSTLTSRKVLLTASEAVEIAGSEACGPGDVDASREGKGAVESM